MRPRVCLMGACIALAMSWANGFSRPLQAEAPYLRPNSYARVRGCSPFLGTARRPLKFMFVDLNGAPYFAEEVRRIIQRQLRGISPFRENFRRMVFYKQSLQGDFGCQESPQRGFACDSERVVEALAKTCKVDDWRGVTIIVIAESSFGGTGGPVIYLGEQPDPKYFRQRRRLAIHEIAHNFGLADLDLGYYDPRGRPSVNWWPLSLARRAWNVDGPGCPKWCAGYKPVSQYTDSAGAACLAFATRRECTTFRRDKQGRCSGECCVWSKDKFDYFDSHCVPLWGTEDIGIDCEPGTGCYFGANYSHHAWRPVEGWLDSIMYSLEAPRFDPISARTIARAFSCCLSADSEKPECAAFRREYSDYLHESSRLGEKARIGSCGVKRASALSGFSAFP